MSLDGTLQGRSPSQKDLSLNQNNPTTDQSVSINPSSSEKEPHAYGGDEEFKEGGLRGWATVVGAILTGTCGFGYTNTFGVYQDYYTRVYIVNSSSSAISWIGSVNSFLVIASGLYVGMLYDRGYFYHLLYGGCFLIAFSLFMLSLTQPDHLYQNFLAQGVGLGMGAGMVFIPSMAVVSQYFVKKRALAMTFVASGSSFGALVHPLMLNNLFYTRLGFQGAVRVSAGMVTVFLIIACLLMHPRHPPPVTRPRMWTSVKKFAKELPYVTVSIGMLFFTIGFYFPIFYLQLDANKHGLNDHFSFYSLVLLNGCGLIGRVTPGFFANSIGVLNMIAAASIGCTALIFGMIGLGSVASVVLIAIFYGFCTGVFISLQTPLIAMLTDDMAEFGTRLGVAYTFCAFGALIGPPINGALLTDKFIWWRPAVVSGAFASVGAMCFLFVVFYLRRAKSHQNLA